MAENTLVDNNNTVPNTQNGGGHLKQDTQTDQGQMQDSGKFPRYIINLYQHTLSILTRTVFTVSKLLSVHSALGLDERIGP